jgi:hypothetical protein
VFSITVATEDRFQRRTAQKGMARTRLFAPWIMLQQDKSETLNYIKCW